MPVKDLYFGSNTEPVRIEKGRKNKNLEVKIQPKGWIKFHLDNTHSVNKVSYFSIQSFIAPNSIVINWPSSDTTFKVITFGNQVEHYYYFLTIDGKEQQHDDTIYYKALDTIDVYIGLTEKVS